MQNVQVGRVSEYKRTASITKWVALIFFLVGLHILFIYKFTIVTAGHQFLLVKLYVFLTGFFLVSRFLIIIFYADSHTKVYAAEKYPAVSFVIAAKNEAESIFKTIITCMDSAYLGKMECIAIDDGSNDSTRQEMQRAADWYVTQDKQVRVIGFDKNRGKREAMAEGILAATGEIIVFVDSDSFLERDALKHIIEHFIEDRHIGAVAGNTGVANIDDNALTKMQSSRYGISFDIFKACESVFGVVTCCPGCFSAYRRDVLLTVLEPWRKQMFWGTRSTFGDDRSLTNYVLKKWKVVYCRAAIATTIVPTHYRKFFKQQLRWKKSWVREGLMAASFIWRKNIIASVSFYTNLLLPIFSPIIVLNAFILQPFFDNRLPVVFMFGVTFLALVYGLFYYWQSNNRYWWYIVPFTLMYTFVLVWQMPYAVLRLRDTTWGTR
jgi:hyaluronan synthase